MRGPARDGQPGLPAGRLLRDKVLWEKVGLILISGLLYSLAISSVGVATRWIPALPLTTLRLATASLIFGVILLIRRPAFRWRPRAGLDLAIIGMCNIGLPFLLLALSLRYISSSLAAIIFDLSPAMTLVMAHFLLKDEKLDAGKVIGTIATIGGAVILLASNASGLSAGMRYGRLGQLMIILAAATGAFGIVYARMRMPMEDVTLLAGGQVFASLAVFIMLALATGSLPQVTAYPWQAWTGVVVSAVTAPVLGYLLLFYMVTKFSASLGGFAAIATPLFAAVTGILFLGEAITIQIALGTLLLLAGCLSLNSF